MLGYVVFASFLNRTLDTLNPVDPIVRNRSLINVEHRAQRTSYVQPKEISHISDSISRVENSMSGIIAQTSTCYCRRWKYVSDKRCVRICVGKCGRRDGIVLSSINNNFNWKWTNIHFRVAVRSFTANYSWSDSVCWNFARIWSYPNLELPRILGKPNPIDVNCSPSSQRPRKWCWHCVNKSRSWQTWKCLRWGTGNNQEQ